MIWQAVSSGNLSQARANAQNPALPQPQAVWYGRAVAPPHQDPQVELAKRRRGVVVCRSLRTLKVTVRCTKLHSQSIVNVAPSGKFTTSVPLLGPGNVVVVVRVVCVVVLGRGGGVGGGGFGGGGGGGFGGVGGGDGGCGGDGGGDGGALVHVPESLYAFHSGARNPALQHRAFTSEVFA